MKGALLATAVGRDLKGKITPLLYAAGIGLSFLVDWLAVAVYAGVALMWLVLDRRLERTVTQQPNRARGRGLEPGLGRSSSPRGMLAILILTEIFVARAKITAQR